MRPDLTGDGRGLEYLNAGIDFVNQDLHQIKLHYQWQLLI